MYSKPTMKNAKSNSLLHDRNLVPDHPSNSFVKRHSSPIFPSDPTTHKSSHVYCIERKSDGMSKDAYPRAKTFSLSLDEPNEVITRKLSSSCSWPDMAELLETEDTKKGSSSSMHSMTKGKHNAQEKAPDFVIPRRTTPPRSARLTSQGEIAYWIKKTNPTGFYADIVDEADGKPRKPDYMVLERGSKTKDEIEALYSLKISN